MEQEFDKEIDALLRKLRPAGFSPDAIPASAHLEADELAAFAENALPDAARQALTLHLADCGRCRKILSETILMNSGAATAAAAASPAPVAEAVSSGIPWYRRLFLLPNLAYVMGGLVLVFSAFLGYVTLRNSGVQNDVVSQAVENAPEASGPNLGPDSQYSSEGVASANTAANAASNAAATAANTVMDKAALSNSTATAEPNATPAQGYLDSKREDFAAPTAAAPPPAVTADTVTVTSGEPVIAPRDRAVGSRDERAKAEEAARLNKEKDDAAGLLQSKPDAAKVAREREEQKMRSMPGTISGGPSKKSAPPGPSRDQQTQFPNRVQNAYDYAVKNAGGKKFELREGIWYDTAYRGQSTVNVRRGTESFLRLDGGLRSIADSVGGTSVIVWGGKAYRIQ